MLKPFKISDLAYQSYRQLTRGNAQLSREEVAKKLTRNVLLGIPVVVENTKYTWYAYGEMRLLVKKSEKIICIINHQPVIEGWKVNPWSKANLNRLLRIN